MHKYTATFSNGTKVVRTSEQEYVVAYRQTWKTDEGHNLVATGFSAKANFVPAPPVIKPIHRGLPMITKKLFRQDNEKLLERSGYRVEYVAPVKTSAYQKPPVARLEEPKTKPMQIPVEVGRDQVTLTISAPGYEDIILAGVGIPKSSPSHYRH